MLKMMKYEFRKSRFSYLVLLGILDVLEIWFLITNAVKSEDAYLPALLLIMTGFIAFAWVLIAGVNMFDRDMNSKSGYLVYMVPVPSWKILLAKVLTTFAAGTVLFFGFYALGLMDVHLMARALLEGGDDRTAGAVLSVLAGLTGKGSVRTLLILFLTLINIVFGVVSLAYFTIALSNTVLRGKKSRKIISVILFIALTLLISWLSTRLFGAAELSFIIGNSGIAMQVTGGGWRVTFGYVMDIVLGIVLLAGTSVLLTKKIDL